VTRAGAATQQPSTGPLAASALALLGLGGGIVAFAWSAPGRHKGRCDATPARATGLCREGATS